MLIGMIDKVTVLVAVAGGKAHLGLLLVMCIQLSNVIVDVLGNSG